MTSPKGLSIWSKRYRMQILVTVVGEYKIKPGEVMKNSTER